MAEQSARVCRSDDPTIDHQMSDIGMDIIENEAGVGDDQRGALRISRCIRSQQPVYRFAYEIGRASCRERVCQYVSISVVAVSLKKKRKLMKSIKSNPQIIN